MRLGRALRPWSSSPEALVRRRRSFPAAEIGSETCNSILAALSSQGRFHPASKLLREMLHLRISPTTLGLGVFLWNFCKSAGLPAVLTSIDSIDGYSFGIDGSVLATLVADGLCQASRPSDASLALEELRSRGFKPDFMAYRVVAESLRSLGKTREAEAVLKRKRKLGVAPREGDYSALIQKLMAGRILLEAKRMGEIIVEGNFPIDSHLLDSLTGFISAEYPESAMEFMKFLVQREEEVPSMDTLRKLCKGVCRKGKGEEEMLRELGSGRLFRGDRERYAEVVSCLCREGKVREAYGVMQEMKRRGKGADVRCYSSVMEACCREEMMGPAKRLWDEMVANACSPNLHTYKSLIWKMSDTGEAGGALRLLLRMGEGHGVAPDDDVYIWVAQGLCVEGDAGAAAGVLSGGSVGPRVWCTVILNLCSKGQIAAATQLLKSPKVDVAKANWEAHVILLKHMHPTAAVGHIEWLTKGAARSLLQAVFSELVASLASAPSHEVAKLELLVQKMMEKTGFDFQSSITRQLWEKALPS